MSEDLADDLASDAIHAEMQEAANEAMKKHGASSVAIFMTYSLEGKTRGIHCTVGNYYANFGVLKRWVTREEGTFNTDAHGEEDES